MSKVLLKTISVILWIWFLVSSILFTPVMLFLWLLSYPFDPKLKLLHQFSCFWGAQYIWFNPLWKLQIADRRKFDDSCPYIMVSNHQSLADILVIYSLFKHFRWTSKAENFTLPFVGWVLSFNRSIRICRNHPNAYELFRDKAVKSLEEGNSVMIFPEGTRSPDGKIRRFKEGAFRLANETKTDILPMVILGTSAAIPKKGWYLRGKQKMLLKVLDPIPFEELEGLSPGDMAHKLQKLIGEEMLRLQSKDH